MIEKIDRNDVQGNILRGYKRAFVRHLFLKIRDRAAARRFLGASVGGTHADVPAITRDTNWVDRKPPVVCFNIGVTFAGLRALGTREDDLDTFPTEFKEGMNARALKLGDFGSSAPKKWRDPFKEPGRLHMIASVYADDKGPLEDVQSQVAKAFEVLDYLDGRNLKGGKVFLGYKDSITQLRFAELDDCKRQDGPFDPLGAVLLGRELPDGLMFRVPEPRDLGFNGTFNAFRILAQDVFAFEAYLDQAARELLAHPDVEKLLPPGAELRFPTKLTREEALREVVAAQMCGRWRDGTPVQLSPGWPDPKLSETHFDYESGARCPVGAHIRRTNPRSGPIVQRNANHTRQLVRRGMSYGPKPDDPERGLVGNFIGASLGAQFEAVMCDWLNLGLQHPDITGSNDPLIGANMPETSWFDLLLEDGRSIRLRGFPRFVTTRGGAYTFLPSLPAIHYLSQLTN